ncbi:MAG TPA: phosphoribosylaminoimidazolesuccinocarboxamide synthase [Vicinamibacterales bacterium]|nr:phosphoribosylaminoimidazolesuccinocarboxamide synthase [Vicinamibacterales bacterium]
MVSTAPLINTSYPELSLFRRGKVRDVYEIGNELLIVATDRISAFDYVLASGIPDKGKVLNQLSAFWFDHLAHVVPNHMIAIDTDRFPAAVRARAAELSGRAMLVRRTEPVPIECVARGYLAGSGWKEYRETGRVCGIALPSGLVESDRLPEPIFTPATKAESGHDINITLDDAAAMVGRPVIERLHDLTLGLYRQGVAHAESRGIIIADTKFEFGFAGGTGPEHLILIDEALTPDSSRFWLRAGYAPGASQPSFDKQFVRDYLEHIKWNKQPPVPSLPDDVVLRTREKYLEAFRRLAGRPLA